MVNSSPPDHWTVVSAEDVLRGRLHRRLEAIGVDRARDLVATPLDRRCIDAAHLVLSDEAGAPGYVHAGFAMTALPHKRIGANEWVRDGADIRLRIESGKTHDGTVVGVPFGYVARLILLYLQTEAILPGRGVDGAQLSLWRETVVLDEVFYESLIRHPLPVRETAIRALSGRSMADDFLVWLSYRLHHLERPTKVPWPAFYRQFGG